MSPGSVSRLSASTLLHITEHNHSEKKSSMRSMRRESVLSSIFFFFSCIFFSFFPKAWTLFPYAELYKKSNGYESATTGRYKAKC